VRNEWEICVFCGSAQQRMAPQISAAPTFVAGQATLQGTSKAQLPGQSTASSLPPAAVTANMATQTMPAQALPDQQPTTSRSYRSPFRRDTGAPPPPITTAGAQPAPAASPVTATPPPLPPANTPNSDIDDAPYRPARLPE
jgi:hypothetical protein